MNKKNHHLYQRNGTYYFQYKGHKQSLKTTSIEEARDLRDILLKELDYRGLGFLEERKVPVFGEAAIQWFQFQEKKGLRPETLRNYKSILNSKVLKASFVNKPVNRIEAYEIEDWSNDQLNQSGGAVATYLTMLSGMFKWFQKRRYIKENPMLLVDRPKRTKRILEPFTQDEINAIISATDEHYKDFVITKFFTGMRIGEICGLRWSCIDFVKKKISINQSLLKGVVGPVKNNKPRVIAMTPVVYDALFCQRKKSLGRSEYVFINTKGKPIHNEHWTKSVWNNTLKRADVKFRSFETTRHTFISHALENGEKPSVVMKHVGHSNLKMIHEHYHGYIEQDDDGDVIAKMDFTTVLPPQQEKVL